MAEGTNPTKPSTTDSRTPPSTESKRRPRLYGRFLALAILIGVAYLIVARAAAQRKAREAALIQKQRITAAATTAVTRRLLSSVEKKIPPHTSFSVFMQHQGVPAGEVHQLIQQARPVYDLGHVRAGNQVTLESSEVTGLRAVRYEINQDQNLWVTRRPDGFHATIKKVPYVIKTTGVTGTVQDSLYEAVEAAGENGNLAVKIADIFGWDIDFNTETRPGDRFAVVVEKKMLDGKFVSYGSVLAADYTTRNHHYDAVLFHDPSGRPAYFSPSGKSMQKAFLRSPLPFNARITSHFNYHRLDPILKRVMPHLGIDYAAPIGSHVQAVADGTVIFAAWDGGAGRLIKIRHSNGYETLYMHLSRLLVHRGEHVNLGQIIGLSGTTGWSTGPHLDFRIEHDGRFLNFLALKLPSAQSVPGKDWKQFVRVKNPMLEELASLEGLPHGAEQASLQSSASHAAGSGE